MKKRLLSVLISCTVIANMLTGILFAKTPEFSLLDITDDAKLAIESGASYIPRTFTLNTQTETALKSAAVFPETYSSVSLGYTSPVKNQFATEVCWDFTHNEVIETYVAKTTGKHVDYSEQTMKFDTSYITNPKEGFDRTPNGSGSEYFSIAYLSRTGSVYEADEPFTTSETRTVDASKLTRHGYLEDAPMFEYTRKYNANAISKMKSLIMEYGAVGSALYYDQSCSPYENSARTSYNYDGSGTLPNHAITVVGWDDNYSASNFAHKPAGNGAFIVKNSWGKYHNNKTSDLVYVSYYDKFITYQFFASKYHDSNDLFNKIYAYDVYGFVQAGSIKTNHVIEAVKYTSGGTEKLNAVGTFTTEASMTVDVYLKAAGDKNYTKIKTQFVPDMGFHLITVPSKDLPKGDFYVAVDMISSNTEATSVQFPLQTKYGNITSRAKNTPNSSFVGSDINDLQTTESIYPKNEAMVCVKAYVGAGCAYAENGMHSWSDFQNDNNATCYQDATRTKHCTVKGCTEKITETITGTATGKHVFGEYISDNNGNCSYDGTKTAHCTTPGCTATDTVPDPGSMTGNHVFVDYKPDGNATCMTDGTKTAHCVAQGCTATDTVADVGSHLTTSHNFSTYTPDGNASCYKDGTKTSHCATPGCTASDTVADEGSATGNHKWSVYISNHDAKCYKDGTKTACCMTPGCTAVDTVTDVGTKTNNHEWGSYTSDNNADCIHNCTKTAHCTNAGCTETDVLEIPNTATGIHKFVTYVSNGDATCMKDGTKTAVCVTDGCNVTDTVTDVGSHLTASHKFGAYTSNNNATCCKDGTKTAHCTVEGCTAVNTVTDVGTATGRHVFGAYTYNNNATYEKDGTETAHCTTPGCTATDTRTKPGTKLARKIIDTSTMFTDVKNGQWYKEYIDYAVSYNMMSGVGNGLMKPNADITRAQFVQILANIEGIDTNLTTSKLNVNTKFTDVRKGQWYTPAVKWANDNKLVDGTSATSFNPNGKLTREAMCKILIGYVDFKKITLKNINPKASFKDDATISAWAKEFVYKCQMSGLVEGTNGAFNPKKTATRAQVATIMTRLDKTYKITK